MRPRWLLVLLILVTDATAVWLGIHAGAAASFLLVLSGISAALALSAEPRTAAAATLALLVPAGFLTLMAGPTGAADCGPACAVLVDEHAAMAARVMVALVLGHAVALALALAAPGGALSPRGSALRSGVRARPDPRD